MLVYKRNKYTNLTLQQNAQSVNNRMQDGENGTNNKTESFNQKAQRNFLKGLSHSALTTTAHTHTPGWMGDKKRLRQLKMSTAPGTAL